MEEMNRKRWIIIFLFLSAIGFVIAASIFSNNWLYIGTAVCLLFAGFALGDLSHDLDDWDE